MPEYRLNEANLNVPSGWKDNSITAFVLPGEEGGGSASFVIIRDAEAAGSDLDGYADQQLINAARQLPSYKLAGRSQVSIAGVRAVQSDFTWTTPEQIPIRQRQACLRHGSLFLVLTLTGRASTFAAYEPVWADVTGSLRLLPASGQ